MLVSVAEIFDYLRAQKKTCVLTFQVEQDPGLLKVYFKDGEVRAMSFGAKRDAECLPLLRDKRLKQYTFISDTGEHIPAGALRTAEVLDFVRNLDVVVCGGVDNAFGHTVPADAVPPDAINAAREAVFDAVGPMAAVLLEECCAKMGYRKDEPLSRLAFKRLLKLLAEDLPADDRKSFLGRMHTYAA